MLKISHMICKKRNHSLVKNRANFVALVTKVHEKVTARMFGLPTEFTGGFHTIIPLDYAWKRMKSMGVMVPCMESHRLFWMNWIHVIAWKTHEFMP